MKTHDRSCEHLWTLMFGLVAIALAAAVVLAFFTPGLWVDVLISVASFVGGAYYAAALGRRYDQ